MRVLLMVTVAGFSLGLSSCNTAIGMSRDVRAFGAGMENVFHGRDFNDSGSPTY